MHHEAGVLLTYRDDQAEVLAAHTNPTEDGHEEIEVREEGTEGARAPFGNRHELEKEG